MSIDPEIIPKARQTNLPSFLKSKGEPLKKSGQRYLRQHGPGQRRTWRKVHVAVDAEVKKNRCHGHGGTPLNPPRKKSGQGKEKGN